MSIWIWIAIIALVVYLMFRRPRQGSGTNCCNVHPEPRQEEAPGEKEILAEDISLQPARNDEEYKAA